MEAIEDVHSIGYLHRDIKAGNFAMSPDRRVRFLSYSSLSICSLEVVLIDFGFAREYVVYDAEKKSCRLRGQRYTVVSIQSIRLLQEVCTLRWND